MAIEIEKENLNINQVVINRNEQVIIEGDCIVPDVKPDVIEIVGTSGIINVYKKEVGEGKVRIDGCISTYIMYIGDDGKERGVRSINYPLDFSQLFSVENATSDMIDEGTISLTSIECKITNERKINIKANVNFEIKIQSNSDIEFVSNVQVKDIQKLENILSVNSVLGTSSTKASVSEKILIDNSDELAEILKVNTQICNIETKTSYNKILTKSDINLKIMYLTTDGRINSTKASFPIMGFIDMKDISDDNICETNIEIKNMVIKPNGSQDHTISIDIDTEISVTAYTKKEINVIQDLYSPSYNLDFKQKSVKTIRDKSLYKGTYNLNQKEMLNIGEEKIYDVDYNVIINEIRSMNDIIETEGNVKFTFTHSENSMLGIQTKVIEVPFNYKISAKGINQNSFIKLNYNIINENINIMPGGEVELKLDIEFIANVTNMEDINLISEVNELDNKNDDSYNMVIYFTRKNDNLWKIAKNFRSTPGIIKEMNNLDSDNLTPGTKLFISKYTG